MAVDAQNPGKVRRYFLFQLNQCHGHLIKFNDALGLEIGPAGVEEYLGLKNETVSHHADVGTVAENFPKLAEEIRAIPLQFINALGQRKIKPLTKLGDAALRLLVLLFGRVQCLLEGGELTAQCCNLLVENLDLGERPRRDFFLAFDLTRQLRSPALSRCGSRTGAVGGTPQPIPLALGDGERRSQLRQLIFEPSLSGFFKPQQLGELCYLGVQPIECGVLPGNFLLQIELNDHEYGKQENDAEYQCRQCVDEARPVVHAAFTAASSCQRHRFSSTLRAPAPEPPTTS